MIHHIALIGLSWALVAPSAGAADVPHPFDYLQSSAYFNHPSATAPLAAYNTSSTGEAYSGRCYTNKRETNPKGAILVFNAKEGKGAILLPKKRFSDPNQRASESDDPSPNVVDSVIFETLPLAEVLSKVDKAQVVNNALEMTFSSYLVKQRVREIGNYFIGTIEGPIELKENAPVGMLSVCYFAKISQLPHRTVAAAPVKRQWSPALFRLVLVK